MFKSCNFYSFELTYEAFQGAVQQERVRNGPKSKSGHIHKKYHVQPKAVVDIFCKPVVPFSTGVTLTKRPFNSYERQVAEFFQNNVHMTYIKF